MSFISKDAGDYLWSEEMRFLKRYRSLYETRKQLRRLKGDQWFIYTDQLKAEGQAFRPAGRCSEANSTEEVFKEACRLNDLNQRLRRIEHQICQLREEFCDD